MLIRDLRKCKEIIAGDHTVLRELLHPDKTRSYRGKSLRIRYSLAHAVVRPGCASRPHRLRTSEVYYILSGRGIMHINDEQRPVRAGQAIYIPPDSRQYIENTGRSQLKFLCIVDPAWRQDDEVVEGVRLKCQNPKLKTSPKFQ
jgi:mannose-6-phosphate isomerase-like protein (cupin superfamily)